ncbi:uncharacterized protein LOC112203720 [Rosa chinensis]|uniref:uncharacterized protein LOC112203720 n=1 Tax=Rosa chinensis TaxID=74649 RepID=UPI000D094459|nr:uncharacterized protein LOC112203720 [Rosa chinensis]
MSEWTSDENIKSTNNQRAINAFYTALSPEKFQLISHCTSAKQIWEVLEVTHEGTSTVRESKLQQFMQQFENMKMGDDEKFDDFYYRLNIIVNGCFNLGDPIPQHRIVKKILRSLPMRFHSKKTAIEESKDLYTYKLQELIGNLNTYEMEIPGEKKMKSMAIKAVKNVKDDVLNDEDDADETALLTRQFTKFLKNKKARGNDYKSDSSSRFTKNQDFSGDKSAKFQRSIEKRMKNGPKCFACDGNGHIASECANTLKKVKTGQNKAMNASWSDSDSEDDITVDNETGAIALIGLVNTIDESDDEPDIEEVLHQYIVLFEASKELKQRNHSLVEQLEGLKLEMSRTETDFQFQLEAGDEIPKSLVEQVQSLQLSCQEKSDKIVELQDDKGHLTLLLEQAEAKLLNANKSEEKLNDILSMGKKFGDKSGLGYSLEVHLRLTTQLSL